MLKSALEQMSRVFPMTVLVRGQEYQEKGHVLNVRLSDGLIKARIKGSSSQIYDLHMDLKIWPKTPSRCSCKQQINCKHAAAILFELKARENPHYIKTPVLMPQQTWRMGPVDASEEEVIDAESASWYSEATESRHEFFSYQLGIMIENKAVNIVPLVADLIRRLPEDSLEHLPEHQTVNLPIAQGKVLQISIGRIKPLLRLLFQFWSRTKHQETSILLNRYQLMLIEEAELAISKNKARWIATEDLQKALQQLTKRSTLPMVPVPNGLKTELRDYQQQGLNWLQFLRTLSFGGVLADDMGLGKTVQTLAHLQYEKEQGRLQRASLIVAPTSVVWNWYDEAKRFTPDLKVLVFHGQERHRDAFNDYDLVISTYGLIQRDKKRFLDYSFYYLILDEAQSIKNTRTKTTQIVQQLVGQHRLCLTGTPLENHLGELWSLFHFLMPGLLGDTRQFRQFFRIPIEKNADVSRRELLVRRVNPFILRRTKNQVARELPEKTEIVLMLELSGAQRDLYEAIRMTMEKKVRDAIAKQGLGKSHILLLDALLKLRQICCDPRLLSLPEAAIAYGTSVKLTSLMELLDNLMEEGRSVLVFSQFTSMLALIEKELIARHYRYLKLTGQSQNRQEIVRDFQKGLAPIFLISLKAGGTGLNLTRADTVIHYDPWWNPAVEDQATDRSHRIGQDNPVFVYKLLSASTVEEVILGMQTKKRQLFEGVLSSHFEENKTLSAADIDQFFAPIDAN